MYFRKTAIKMSKINGFGHLCLKKPTNLYPRKEIKDDSGVHDYFMHSNQLTTKHSPFARDPGAGRQ